MDSLLRLRQLNQPELSGYITQALFPAIRASGISFSGLSMVPTGSGVYNLGTPARVFGNVYVNQILMPSGSGINFGGVPFTAYTSGTSAVVRVGDYYITTSSQGVSIIGPSGVQGLSGATGASGVSGIGVSGTIKSGNFMNVYLTNGRIDSIALVSGATGASGVSLSGFYQSGTTIFPIFTNAVTGTSGIRLVSGATGPQGIAGGILIDCNQFTGYASGQRYPAVTIYNVDPLGSENPTMNFIKGMRYSIGVSGLNILTINGTGTNLYTGENRETGYLRFCFWDSTIVDSCSRTGRLIKPECPAISSAAVLDDLLRDSEAWTSVEESSTKSLISFNVKWSADTGYRYGFIRSNLDGTTNDSNPGGYVLGSAAVSYYGPTGPSGARGLQGIPGPQGQRGPAGNSSPGVGISSTEQNASYQIRFHYTDNTTSDWFNMPVGGPQGTQGPAGATGPSGADGPQGPQGIEGDSYAASFYVNAMRTTYSNVTYTGFQKQVNGLGAWILCTGGLKTCTTGDLIWFSAESLIGFAYTPWQKVLFSNPTYSTPNNFYATISAYNTNNGEIQAVISTTPVVPTTNPINFDDYVAGVNVNLGGLGSPGPSGAQGVAGPSGASGASGSSLFRCSPMTQLTAFNADLDATQYNLWDLYITGTGHMFDFDTSTFPIGGTVLARIMNSGSHDNNEAIPLIYWQNCIRFPNNDTTAPGPRPSAYPASYHYANTYTFVRFPNTGADVADIMCTYAVDYIMPR